ncbi:MAG: TRZ/ATZ family protein [Caldisericales bacterium]|nr:fumarate hydratase C-terminal domain-containing protein [Caldisericia bacterium]NMD14664.1 TRZ/ATZ family protein [Caldisericales bacterium]
MKEHKLTTPVSKEFLADLVFGDEVLITGTIYTARDAAHKAMLKMVQEGGRLPFDPKGAIIYFAGPSPAPPGFPVGSCGPTTSSRMDPFTRTMFELGIAAQLGKGPREQEVTKTLVDFGGVYLVALGGAGALLAEKVKKARLLAFPELGPEAVYELEVEDFPAIVAIDSKGNNIFKR